VQVVQPAKGHRFTLDSILLADFCRIKPKERVLEPGAGTGIISILLAKKHQRANFTAVEVQQQLAELCERNILFAVPSAPSSPIRPISRKARAGPRPMPAGRSPGTIVQHLSRPG
jgi:hypothetical protein